MNDIARKLLEMIADWKDGFAGAYNLREDGACAGRQDSAFTHITPKYGKPGIDIHVDAGAQDETVYIPACVTHSGVDDLVYNDFYIAAGAKVTIVAGCGVHSEGEEEARHNGIHRFFVEEGAEVKYLEKHVGTGDGTGQRVINPQTEITLGPGAVMEMDTSQIGGVDSTKRSSKAVLGPGSRLIIREKIMTHGIQSAETDFTVDMDGEDCAAELSSRSVARGQSHQFFRSCMNGNTRCTGHSECDALIMDAGIVGAAPELSARHIDAALIHEAAIGKIAGEQIMKLMSLGLSEREAEEKIIEGFLK